MPPLSVARTHRIRIFLGSVVSSRLNTSVSSRQKFIHLVHLDFVGYIIPLKDLLGFFSTLSFSYRPG